MFSFSRVSICLDQTFSFSSVVERCSVVSVGPSFDNVLNCYSTPSNLRFGAQRWFRVFLRFVVRFHEFFRPLVRVFFSCVGSFFFLLVCFYVSRVSPQGYSKHFQARAVGLLSLALVRSCVTCPNVQDASGSFRPLGFHPRIPVFFSCVRTIDARPYLFTPVVDGAMRRTCVWIHTCVGWTRSCCVLALVRTSDARRTRVGSSGVHWDGRERERERRGRVVGAADQGWIFIGRPDHGCGRDRPSLFQCHSPPHSKSQQPGPRLFLPRPQNG